MTHTSVFVNMHAECKMKKKTPENLGKNVQIFTFTSPVD